MFKTSSFFLFCLSFSFLYPKEASLRGFVTNIDTNNVSIIDISSNQIITTINVGAAPIFVALSPDGRRAYVANSNSNNISIINTITNSIIGTIATQANPLCIAVDPTGSKIVVVNRNSSTLQLISTLTKQELSSLVFNSDSEDISFSPSYVAISSDGKKAYASILKLDSFTGFEDGFLSVIDMQTFTMTASIPIGTLSTCVVIKQNTNKAYVSNTLSTNLSVIDLTTNTLLSRIICPEAPTKITLAQGLQKGYIISQSPDSFFILDTASDTILSTFSISPFPTFSAVTPDEKALYFTNGFESSVEIFDLETEVFTQSLPVGNGPSCIAIGLVPPEELEIQDLLYAARRYSPIKIQRGLND